METRKIGSLDVSIVGLGCNNFGMRIDAEQTERVVAAALDAGITFFDTADIYGGTKSEEFLGAALERRRDRVILATKFGNQVGADGGHRGASKRWITQAVEDSLRRLRTDRIDLYQQHVPDADVPIEETLEALDDLVRAGKVREIGNSNFTAKQIAEADEVARANRRARFVGAQNQYSLLVRDAEDELLPACRELGLAFVPYFPLASGLLTGKYTRGASPPEGSRLAWVPEQRRNQLMTDRAFGIVEELTTFAMDRDHSLLELAFSWLLSQDGIVSVIAGATTPEQVRANATAATWRLGAEELDTVDRITRRRP